MKPLATLIVVLGLSACATADMGGAVQTASPSAPENLLLAREPGGAWTHAAPLSGLDGTPGAECATTSKGTACLLQGDAAAPDRGLATVRDGRCLARWGSGPGTRPGIVTLHRNAEAAPRAPRFERLYYPLNSGKPLDATSRLTDPAAFTRLCDQILQPDSLTTRVLD